MNCFMVGRPIRYRFSSLATGGAASIGPGSLAGVALESTSSVVGDAIILQPFFSCHPVPDSSLLCYHHDQNSTLTVRASRRVTRSIIRLWPQKILACPVISGLRSRAWLSIWVVTRSVLGFTLARLKVVAPDAVCPGELKMEPEELELI